MFNQITPVIKNIIIVNVLVFIAASTLPQYIPNLALNFPRGFAPYQLVTHFFMHASVQHLLFNMLGLFFLGPMVEQRLGGRDFLILYLLCAFGSAAAHLGYVAIGNMYGTVGNVSAVGASGAVYGVVIAFATLYPNVKLQLLFPPVPILAKYMAMIYIGIDLYQGLANSSSNVAHFAHLGGALMGFLLIKFYFGKRR